MLQFGFEKIPKSWKNYVPQIWISPHLLKIQCPRITYPKNNLSIISRFWEINVWKIYFPMWILYKLVSDTQIIFNQIAPFMAHPTSILVKFYAENARECYNMTRMWFWWDTDSDIVFERSILNVTIKIVSSRKFSIFDIVMLSFTF